MYPRGRGGDRIDLECVVRSCATTVRESAYISSQAHMHFTYICTYPPGPDHKTAEKWKEKAERGTSPAQKSIYVSTYVVYTIIRARHAPPWCIRPQATAVGRDRCPDTQTACRLGLAVYLHTLCASELVVSAGRVLHMDTWRCVGHPIQCSSTPEKHVRQAKHAAVCGTVVSTYRYLPSTTYKPPGCLLMMAATNFADIDYR